jgi:hypothetical protein
MRSRGVLRRNIATLAFASNSKDLHEHLKILIAVEDQPQCARPTSGSRQRQLTLRALAADVSLRPFPLVIEGTTRGMLHSMTITVPQFLPDYDLIKIKKSFCFFKYINKEMARGYRFRRNDLLSSLLCIGNI